MKFKFTAIYPFFLFLFISQLSWAQLQKTTAIIGALDEEIELFKESMTQQKKHDILGIEFISGLLENREVVLAQTSVGKVNAAIVTILLIEHFQPQEVIFTGIAGGLNADLHPGDIVVAEKVAQHDFGTMTAEGLEHWGTWNAVTGSKNPIFFDANNKLLQLTLNASKVTTIDQINTSEGKRLPQVIRGTVVTGDMFIASDTKKNELIDRMEADAVEMEGGAVMQVCWQLKVPCIIIRSISDSADNNAKLDYEGFIKVAARNSSQLVIELIKELAN